jgi:hypothetical protein
MNGDQHLIVASARLQAAAGVEWDEFLKAFERASQERLQDMLSAPPDQLSMAQGRARALSEVLHTLTNARTLLPGVLAKLEKTNGR